MKKYISIIVLVSLFVIGCSEQTSINSPVNDLNINEPSWISLPSSNGMKVNSEWVVSKKINGKHGGSLSNKISYNGGISGTVDIEARIDFDQEAYQGNAKIIMALNDFNTSTRFSPSLHFNRTVLFNATYKGLDLTGLDPTTIRFAFLANNGGIVMASCDSIIVNISQGKLQVVNAVIPHFSRYGFVN